MKITTAEASPEMRHRSWYMRADVADQLAAVVDDVHFVTRRPRHEVLAALVDVALEHRGEIEARLTRRAGGG
jgi:hypothetical protein